MTPERKRALLMIGATLIIGILIGALGMGLLGKQSRRGGKSSLFETTYNKTIQAWHHGNTEAEQDAWFEKQFAPWDRYDLLLPILSSLDWEARVPLLAERLNRRFLSLAPESGLEDILSVSQDDLEAVLRPRIERIQNERDEDKRVEVLLQRVKAASPYRALQAEGSFWVLSQFAQSNSFSENIRQMALKRLAEVSVTPLERGSFRLLKLGYLLSGGYRSCRPAVHPGDR